MYELLQVITVVLVVLAMVPALAHALELPGKLRLTKEAYVTVQPIYYPGFTFAGFSEPLAIVATLVVLGLAPQGTTDFWLILAALIALVAMHGVYWLATHPVNNFWLEHENLSRLGSGFFSFGSGGKRRDPDDWKTLRNRWEYSHVVRAALATVGFIALLVAASSCTA
jgi:hypothetical protein